MPRVKANDIDLYCQEAGTGRNKRAAGALPVMVVKAPAHKATGPVAPAPGSPDTTDVDPRHLRPR
jgi:hypothetical protein